MHIISTMKWCMHPVAVSLQVDPDMETKDFCREVIRCPCTILLPLVQSGIPARRVYGHLLLNVAPSYSLFVGG